MPTTTTTRDTAAAANWHRMVAESNHKTAEKRLRHAEAEHPRDDAKIARAKAALARTATHLQTAEDEYHAAMATHRAALVAEQGEPLTRVYEQIKTAIEETAARYHNAQGRKDLKGRLDAFNQVKGWIEAATTDEPDE